MRKHHNVKTSGFTYHKVDILSAVNAESRTAQPVQHIALGKGVHHVDKDMIDWAKSLDPLSVPVFHRFRRQVECPSALGLALSPLAS